LSWCHGEVIAIKDANKKTVKVRWAEEHVGKGDLSEQFKNCQIVNEISLGRGHGGSI
jgi:hypothetical protein